jgi:hypothetical protein
VTDVPSGLIDPQLVICGLSGSRCAVGRQQVQLCATDATGELLSQGVGVGKLPVHLPTQILRAGSREPADQRLSLHDRARKDVSSVGEAGRRRVPTGPSVANSLGEAANILVGDIRASLGVAGERPLHGEHGVDMAWRVGEVPGLPQQLSGTDAKFMCHANQ